MKKIYLMLLGLIMSMSMMAQGWPANYKGVMLQGFYWDGYEDGSWKSLIKQADELSEYFDLIWVPQSGYCNTLTNQMGYAPIWWFRHDSAFSSEAELRQMIQLYKSKGVGIIEDVVINHRNGNTNWCDFPTEVWKGHTMSWTLADICRNDDGGETLRQGYNVTGAYISSYRAYFQTTSGVPAKQLILLDDETTGISTLTDQQKADNNVYTIDGMWVGKNVNTTLLKKGIYIMNGKKIVIP